MPHDPNSSYVLATCIGMPHDPNSSYVLGPWFPVDSIAAWHRRHLYFTPRAHTVASLTALQSPNSSGMFL